MVNWIDSPRLRRYCFTRFSFRIIATRRHSTAIALTSSQWCAQVFASNRFRLTRLLTRSISSLNIPMPSISFRFCVSGGNCAIDGNAQNVFHGFSTIVSWVILFFFIVICFGRVYEKNEHKLSRRTENSEFSLKQILCDSLVLYTHPHPHRTFIFSVEDTRIQLNR